MDALEAAFDTYLEAALRGDAEPPEQFLDRHPNADPALSRQVHAIYAERATASPASAVATDGRRIAQFRLVRRIGDGGMGVVWEAEQEPLGRRVALKVLREDLDESPEARERFERESRMLAQLDHPGIVRVIAAGRDDGTPYIAMDLVSGDGLDELLRDVSHPLVTSRVLSWGASLARALAYAHERGIIHRDVKPSNVIVTPADEALLVDFGIARTTAAALPTLTGPFVGSAAYAPPEQLSGARVDGRADVYGLGATLYQCLTGVPAFDGATVDQLIHNVLTEPHTPPSRRVPGLSRDVDLVLGKALAKVVDRRYASAEEFADDLEALLAFRPVAARAPGAAQRAADWARAHPAISAALATIVLALLGVIGAGAWQARTARERRRDEARDSVRQAAERFETYRERHAGSAELEHQVIWQQSLLESQYLDAAEIAKLDAWERELGAQKRERELVFHEVLALLRRAERLDPEVAGAGQVRSALFAQKHGEAVARKDDASAAFYADLVAKSDVEGQFIDAIRGTGTVSVTTQPTGARVHVFRYVEHAEVVDGGDRRWVPVPVRGSPDGGDPGELAPRDAGNPDGRRTAARVRLGETSLVGAAPTEALELARGEYLAVAELEGRVTARRLFRVRPGFRERILITLPAQAVPGCVLIPTRAEHETDAPFWIMTTEVTAGDYLDYLNRAATRAEIDASQTAIRFPRAPENVASGGYWRRGDDGRFSLAPDWSPDWPVLGVSWEDAVAYARWKTAADSTWTYRLPTLGEALAAAGEPHRRYAFGMHFRPGFASACYARPRANPAPVGSHPIDESPYGVYDLSGSASEWCDGWYDEARGLRRANFGNWASAKAEAFRIWSAAGWPATAANGTVGFRLVLERE